MRRLQAYQYELQRNGEQQRLMRRFAGREEAGLCGIVQGAHGLAQCRRNRLAGGSPGAPSATDPQGSEAGLYQLRRQARRVPALQEKGRGRQLPLPRCLAIQDRRRQLEYKQAWRGAQVVAVNPRHTSQTCPDCGHVSAENRQSQARFACVECGFEENAELVGAINILAAGHAVWPMEERRSRTVQRSRNPAEATTQELALV